MNRNGQLGGKANRWHERIDAATSFRRLQFTRPRGVAPIRRIKRVPPCPEQLFWRIHRNKGNHGISLHSIRPPQRAIMSDLRPVIGTGRQTSRTRRNEIMKMLPINLNRIFGVVAATVLALVLWPQISRAQDADDATAFQLEEAAFNAQTSGDFEFAADGWDTFIKQFPDHKDFAKALFNAGYCRVQLEQYEPAAERLARALEKLADDQKKLRAQTLLYLGYAELRHADQRDIESAAEWYHRSAQHLKQLIEAFPDFDDLDQAWFFLGNAQEGLGDADAAIASYRHVAENAEATFHRDAIYYLATLLEQNGEYDAARDEYQRVIELDGSDSLADEARFRMGECHKQQGLEMLAAGATPDARLKLQAALDAWKPLLQNETQPLPFRDELMFQTAIVHAHLGQSADAATWFERVAQMPDSPRAARAATLAGREWFLAQQDDRAAEILQRAMQTDGDNAAEAAHWKAKILLHQNQFKPALDLASKWVDRASDPNVRVPLMLDLADAAYGLPDQRRESVDLYQRIQTAAPEHPLAPAALYYAAYAALETEDLDRAVQLAARFTTQYSENEYLPDVLEVAGDAHLLKGNAAEAVPLFERLVDEFPQHPKHETWIVRAGLARFENDDHPGTIEWLKSRTSQLTRPELIAEAWHWIGASHFQLKQFDAAGAAYQQALQADPNWRRADESLLGLARSQWESNHQPDALATARELIERFPQSPLVAEAWYRTGQWSHDQQDYAAAAAAYQQVIEHHADSFFRPYALFGIAWALTRHDDLAGADAAWSELVREYPDHELTTRALIAQAAGLRQQQKFDQAVSVLKPLVDNPAESVAASDRADALYELGLVQIAREAWPDVIATFSRLIDMAPDHPKADRFLYELGWAARAAGEHDRAAREFRRLVEQHPRSELAADAHFHLGQYAYDAGEYDKAIEHYRACVESARSPDLKEKATYKIGWSLYRLERYADALAEFRKQTEQFADGLLYADALFMVSESLYKQRDHEGALAAYQVARPVIEQSTTVAPEIRTLTLLHGAQCANQAKKYDEAIALAKEIIDADVPLDVQQDAWLEMGIAHAGLGDGERALEAWTRAAANPGETGAHARCLVGDHYFQLKQFDKAINQYKLAFYGYGGKTAEPDVRRWQAYAVYETARCNLVRAEADPDSRDAHIAEAVKWLKYLIETYPDDALVEESKRQLDRLNGNNR